MRKQRAAKAGPIKLKDLHVLHGGLTPECGSQICQCASVMLDRHHTSPKEVKTTINGTDGIHSVEWDAQDQRARNSNANLKDATRDGAYAVSLAFLERTLNLHAVSRAEEGTGADWYVAPPGKGFDDHGEPNLDDPSVYRVEVSGVDVGPIGSRITDKAVQLSKGRSNVPGIVSIVGFERAIVFVAECGGRPK